MSGHHYSTVFDVVTGRPVTGVTVEVYQDGATLSGDSVTSGTYATIYSDDGVTTIDQSDSDNWVTTDSRGYYEFWTDETSVVLAYKYNGTAMDAIDDVEVVGGTVSSDLTAVTARVDKHDTLFGTAANATDLGTFTGSTISDNDDVVGALQSLETAIETVTGGGTQQIWIPATSMTARATNGPSPGASETTTNAVMVSTFDFDASTDEAAQIRWQMPTRWDEGTYTATFVWTAGTTGNVVWGSRAVAISNDDPMDSAFGTAATVTDGVTAADDLMISAATSAITIAGAPAANDFVVFEFYRDADNGSDTLAADASLLGVTITITTDADDDS